MTAIKQLESGFTGTLPGITGTFVIRDICQQFR